MAYQKQTFVNNSTVLTAEHLEHIEEGIYQNSVNNVKSINGTTPDENGNVEIETGEDSTVTEIKSIFTDIVTFLKAVPFDDTVASASDLDAIQSKIDALSTGDTGGDDAGDEPTETVSATFSGGALAISGTTVNSATFSNGILAVE